MERSGKLFYYGRPDATTLHQSKFWRSSKPELFSLGLLTHPIWLLYTSLTHSLFLSLSFYALMRQKGCTELVRGDKDQRAASPCLFQGVSPGTLLLHSLPPTILLFSDAYWTLTRKLSPFPRLTLYLISLSTSYSLYLHVHTHTHTFLHTSFLL